ncbi:MAG: hypothetical protein GX079_01905 [Tissierellia bacterium]|nr:hypothetical protein [Tissierellia bacterium]
MPGNWTHYYFARDVALDNGLKFKEDKDYYLGAMGPDLLSFLPEGRDREIFNLLRQDRTEEVLCFVFNYMGEGQLESYLHGFLAHYSLDSESGFFINSLQNEGFDKQSVKMALDEAVLRRRNSKILGKPNLFPLVSLGKNLPEPIARFYLEAVKTIYDYELDSELLNQSYRKLLRLLKHSGSSMGLLSLAGSWYDKPPEQLLPPNISEKLYLEFLPNYEEAREFFQKLLEDQSPCAMRNFSGDYI